LSSETDEKKGAKGRLGVSLRNQIMEVTDKWLPVWIEQFRALK
jgi:hypothetical protein